MTGVAKIVALALVLSLPAGALSAAERPVAGAAMRGDIEMVRQLLRGGADVNTAHGDGMTALHWAADQSNVGLGEILIYAGADVGAGTRIGQYTPLHIAARKGHIGMVELLLKAGADPGAATVNSGVTPLHLAAASENPDVVVLLLKAGAKVDSRESAWGQTPLIFASAAGRVETIKALLEAGADPALTAHSVNVIDREKGDRAAEKRLSEFLADFKKKEGGGTDWQPSPSQVQAAIRASREIQRRWPDVPDPKDDKKLAEEEAKGDGEGESKGDAEGEVEGVEEAIEEDGAAEAPEAEPTVIVTYNADGEPVYDNSTDAAKDGEDQEPKPPTYGELVESWGGLTPLLHAVRQGHFDASMAILQGGADINQPSAGDQSTPLLIAAVNGHFDLALALLEMGADPNLVSSAGTTPLFAVLERNWAPKASYSHPVEHQQQEATHTKVINALLEAGADPNVRLSRDLWYTEYTFPVLRRAGIHLKGATPFWRAAQALDIDAMRLLTAHGADPNTPTIKLPKRKEREEDEETDDLENIDEESYEGAETTSDLEASKETASAEDVAEADGERDEKVDEEEDHSGVPPIPVGGPFIYPIHVAAGAGYGQYFAGNAHRHAPGKWMATLRLLVEELGADVNLRDANGYTALHHAASRGDNEMVRYLIEKGADVTVVSRKGQTTADMANGPIERLPPFLSTVALLEKFGSKNNHKCVSC